MCGVNVTMHHVDVPRLQSGVPYLLGSTAPHISGPEGDDDGW